MPHFIRTIICSLIAFANVATGFAAYGAVWCHESDGRVSFENSYEKDACHDRQASGTTNHDETSLTSAHCIDVPAFTQARPESAPKFDVDRLMKIVPALVTLLRQSREICSTGSRLPLPPLGISSTPLTALKTIVLVV